ncbi:cytochrome b5 reductase 4 isoform X2 [Neocloeon triangulifer]|uniref:cytochrome b5 reductase 4 isoform X2 n=1 Tax=Neocloeon triangulifer TaxID=2078957 RepID=UPI00286F99D5|nr:cytochrome b5 reductase 4 isoform X2 [Neocloeon triangulifer]
MPWCNCCLSKQSEQEHDPPTAGNPRNKVALRPGHSLMDWIRLGNSGKDLTGVGGVSRDVAASELAKHNRQEDAWLAVKGRVYNVTHYMDFHPGGVEELMRGVGKDATSLFNQVHAWVNYESILQKCQVGPLRGGLLFSASKPMQPLSQLLFGKKGEKGEPLSGKAIENKSSSAPSLSSAIMPKPSNPRLDWFQQLGAITLVLYARQVSRGLGKLPPWVRVTLDEGGTKVGIFVCNVGGEPGQTYEARLELSAPVRWPCSAVRVHPDSGKVEVVLKKETETLWKSFGTPAEGHGAISQDLQAESEFWPVYLADETQVNHNTKVLRFQFSDRVCFTVPVGHHFRVQTNIQGVIVARSYTPIVPSLKSSMYDCDSIYLMVKSYPDGALSSVLCKLEVEQKCMEVSRPVGNFDVRCLNETSRLFLVAAGTGITPMIRVIVHILADGKKYCKMIKLAFFNKTEKDILWKEEFSSLSKEEPRFSVLNILSEASDGWPEARGRISRNILESLLDVKEGQSTSDALKQEPTFYCICGPTPFTEKAQSLLNEMGVPKSQYHCFLG